MRFFLSLLIVVSILLSSCSGNRTNERIDHIILVVNDLEKGMQQFEELTGVKPVFGGKHPNSFTQDALVSLDRNAYIEILAPRTDVPTPDWMMQYRSLTPSGWAIYTADIEATRKELLTMGFSMSEVMQGMRAKQDGSMLSWLTMGFTDKDTQVFPFFIQWGEGVVHPAASSPSGCSIVKFEISTEDKDLEKLNEHFKLGISNGSGETRLVLRLRTPKGMVTFPAY